MSPIVIINHGLLLLSLSLSACLSWALELDGSVEVVATAAFRGQQRASECMARNCRRVQGDKRLNTVHLNVDGFPLNPYPFPSLPSLLPRCSEKNKDFSTSNPFNTSSTAHLPPPALSRVYDVMDVT